MIYVVCFKDGLCVSHVGAKSIPEAKRIAIANTSLLSDSDRYTVRIFKEVVC